MTSQPILSHSFLLLFFSTTVAFGQIFGQPYFPVKIDQKWGLIDTSGQIVVAPQYDLIGTPQQFGYTFSQTNGRLGLLNRAGKVILPTQYDDIAIIDSSFFRITEAGKNIIINTQGNAILSADKFTQIKVVTPTILAYAINGQYGCINERGKVLLPTAYDDISLFKNRYLQLHRGKHRGLATFDGKVILEPIADQFDYHSDSLIFYQKGVLWGALDDFGNHLIAPQYSSYKAVNQRLFKLERFGEFWLYDKQTQQVISKQPQQDFHHFSNQYIKTRRGSKFGIIDYTGRTILENQYEVLYPYSSEAFCVEQAGKWGIIGQNGQQILSYQYDYISQVRNGHALLKKGAFFGLADKKGTLLLPTVYTKINISKDKIKAFKGEKWTLFYFDDEGKIQRGNDFKKHFKIRVANQNIDNQPNRLFNGSFDEGNRVGDFEWFYDITKGKWGLRRLSDGEITIKPTYDFIQIERDLGYTLVGIEKQGQYRFGLTDYRFNYVYGIVNNEVGKLVTHLKLWDVRASDFRSGSEVARVVFNNGRHGLMLRNGKFLKKDFGYIGAFKNGLAKFSIGGKISAQLRPPTTYLGTLPDYLEALEVGSTILDFTLHDQQIGTKAHLTCQDCSWGFIDTTASIIIQPKYEDVQDFENGIAIVKEKGKWGTIDQLGNPLINAQYDELAFLENTQQRILKLGKVTPKFGLMDTLGQLVVPLEYNQLTQLAEDRLAVKKDNEWGFVNENGQMVIPPQYSKVAAFSEGLAAVKWQRKWVFIDKNGQIQLDSNYRAVGNFRQGKAWVKTNDGVGYIHQDGSTAIPFEFDRAFDFQKGVARVVKDGKYGLIDESGAYILRPKFSRIDAFDESGLAIVRYGNKVTRYGVINRKGEKITPLPYQKVFSFREGRALVKHRDGYGFIDPNGQLVIVGNYSKAGHFSEGRAMVQRNGRCGYIDVTGREVVPLEYSKCLDFSEGRAVVYKGLRKGGIIDKNGVEIIEPSVNRLLDFQEGKGLVRQNQQFYYISEDATWEDGYFEKAQRFQHGVATVQKNRKWGLINQRGLNLVTHKYDQVGVFQNGLAKVGLRQFSGLATLDGQLILSTDYEYIAYVGAGIFRIENGDQIGYLRKDGRWIWPLEK